MATPLSESNHPGNGEARKARVADELGRIGQLSRIVDRDIEVLRANLVQSHHAREGDETWDGAGHAWKVRGRQSGRSLGTRSLKFRRSRTRRLRILRLLRGRTSWCRRYHRQRHRPRNQQAGSAESWRRPSPHGRFRVSAGYALPSAAPNCGPPPRRAGASFAGPHQRAQRT